MTPTPSAREPSWLTEAKQRVAWGDEHGKPDLFAPDRAMLVDYAGLVYERDALRAAAVAWRDATLAHRFACSESSAIAKADAETALIRALA